MCFVNLIVFGGQNGQVSETKKPLAAGKGCADVTSKLKRLTVGKMKVKTCCGGIVLLADVKEQAGKKTIVGWYVQDSNGSEVKAEKGLDSEGRNTIIQTEDAKACFIVEKRTN
jgi:hypothetical protein